MAVFSGMDLRNWRNSKDVSAEELGMRIGYDASTIYRIEKEVQIPGPKEMMLICDALGDRNKWDAWMRTVYPESYGRMVPEPTPYGLEGSILALKTEMRDIKSLMQDTIRDGTDGKIDNFLLRERLLKELTELVSAAQGMIQLLNERSGENGA